MKRFSVLVVLFVCVFAVAGSAFAAKGGAISVPTVDGDDVLVPDAFIQTVPGATTDNVWARFHDGPQTWVKMVKEGNVWRIPGGRGKDVHPFIGDYTTDYAKKKFTNFAKIEDMGWEESPFVKYRGENKPCLHVQ